MGKQTKLYGILFVVIIAFIIGRPIYKDIEYRNNEISNNVTKINKEMLTMESQIEEMQNYIDNINENYILISTDSDTYKKIQSGWYTVSEDTYYRIKNIGDQTEQNEIVNGLVQDSLFMNVDKDYIEFNEADIEYLDCENALNMNCLLESRWNITEELENIVEQVQK